MPEEKKKSSMFKDHSYDAATETLRLVFNNDEVYEYHPVPPTTIAEMEAAESMGRYFIQNIRNAVPFTRIEQEDEDGEG